MAAGFPVTTIAFTKSKWDYRLNTYLGFTVPIGFDFDTANGILRCRLEGKVTDEDVRALYRQATDHADAMKPRAGIIDLSGTTSFEVARETILELAHTEPAVRDPKVTRVVIAGSPVVFGMARMFEMEGERTRPNFYVVRTEQEAWAILQVWKPRFEPLKKNPS